MNDGERYGEEDENELNKIPQDVLAYANKIIDLQELLMTLSIDNISDSIEELKENGYFETESFLNSFVCHLLEVPDFRPSKISLLCTFVNQLFESLNDKPELIEYILNELLRQLFLSLSNPNPFPNESSRPNFLYNLYKQKVLTIESIIVHIQRFLDNYTWFAEPIAWIVSYFIELVPDEILKETKRRLKIHPNTNPIFLDFFNTYSTTNTSENIEKKNMNAYVEILKNDDVEELKKALNPLFEFDTIIKPSIFEPCYFIQREPTLILCAAYFGSIKCFKYLLLNHANLNKRDTDSKSLAQFAVAGGNVEIVRLVEQSGCDFSDTAHIATHFYHSDIFEWLHLTKFPDLNKNNFDRYSILHHAAYSGNIGVLVKCINSGCDVNKYNNPLYKETPILKAAENGKSAAVKILLSVDEIDPNIRCNSETPLMFAARNGRDECVKFLCDSEKVDVLAVGELGTALHYASLYCQTDCVRILVNSNRIDTEILNRDGQNAFYLAKRVRAVEIEKILAVNRNALSPIYDFLNRYSFQLMALLLLFFIIFW